MGEKEGTTPTQEDFDKMRSSYDRKLAESNKSIQTLTDKLSDVEAQLEEAKLAGEDMEDLEQLRQKIKEISKDLRDTQKERDELKTENTEQQKKSAISKIAAQHGVDEEALLKYETEAEMKIAAADLEIARLKSEKQGAPSKEKFTTPSGVGATGDDIKGKTGRQLIREGIEERDS